MSQGPRMSSLYTLKTDYERRFLGSSQTQDKEVKPEQVHIAVWEKLRHSNGSSATTDPSNDSGFSMTSSPLPSPLINARESNGIVFHTPQT